jgi:cation transport ATPase
VIGEAWRVFRVCCGAVHRDVRFSIAMSGSSLIVAANALLLKRTAIEGLK